VSRENVEIVRRIYTAGWLDRTAGQEHLVHDDWEYVNPPDAITPGVRRGPQAAEALRSLADAFDQREHRLQRVFDAGDRVVAEVTFVGRGASSGAEVSQQEAHTWTFRDGRVVRFEWGRNLAHALKAVGLEE
jgi:ketosteroid isomerase-like protein